MARGNKGVVIPITFDIEDATRSAEIMGKKIEEALNRHKGTENPQIAQIMKSLSTLQDKLKSTAKFRDDLTNGSANYQDLVKLTEHWYGIERSTKQAYDAYREYLRGIGKGNLVDKFSEAPNAIDKRYFGKNRTPEISAQIEKLKELQSAWANASSEYEKYNGMKANAEPNPLSEDETQAIAKNFRTAADAAEIFLLKLNQAEKANEKLNQSSGNNSQLRRNFYLIRTLTNDISKGLRNLESRLKKFTSGIAGAAKHMLGLGKESRKTTSSINNGFNRGLRYVLQYGFGIRSLYFLFRRLRKYAKEALDEMAKQIPFVNAQMSRAAQALNQMKGSIGTLIQPLLNVLVPVLEKVAALISRIASLIGGVFAVLTGQGKIYKATAGAVDYAASLDKTGASAKKAKKELEGYLSPIDEINKYQSKRDDEDDKTGGGAGATPAFTFEEAEPSDLAKKVADFIKRLINPIKKAWANMGDFVKKSWKRAWDEIVKLGQSVARDFWRVWEEYDTQKIFENIFEAIGWIGQAVGNLARNFREAWDENDTGYKILKAIRDIVLIITNHIRDMAKATADWADKLDFSPILTKFAEWLESLKGPADAIMGILEDLYEQVLLPLGKWAVEEGGPKLLQVFIDFNEKVDWEGLRSKLSDLWSHLEPFAERVGEGLILFIEDVSNALANFINSKTFQDFLDKVKDWMDNVDAEDVARTIKLVAGAIIVLKGALFALEGIKFINTVTASISTFLGLFGAGGTAATAATTMKTLSTSMVDLLGVFDGWNRVVSGMVGTGAFLQGFNDLKDTLKLSALKKEFDDGKISLQEYTDKLKELGGLGKSMGSTNALDSYLDKSKQLKEYLDNGTLTMQEYQSEMSNLNQKYSISSDSVSSLTTKFDDYHTKLKEAHDQHYANVELMENATKKTEEYGKSIQVTAGAARAAKGDTEAYTTTNKSFIDRIKENINVCKDYSNSMNNNVDPALKNMKTTTTDTSEKMQLEMHKMGISVGGDIDGVNDKLNGLKSSFNKDTWTFSGVADGLGETFKNAVNRVGDFWNSMADSLNGEHSVFGKSFSISLPRIPRLAQGAVIPPNKEFMAVLGDQKNGTNIETPLDTMIEAFNAALSQNNGGGRTEINFLLPDRRRLAQYVVEGGRIIQTSTGKSPFDLA